MSTRGESRRADLAGVCSGVHSLRIDVKFIEPTASTTGRKGGRGKYYQFTASDDCTRLRVLRIHRQLNQKTQA
ncbi:hypothetical protein ACFOY2_22080 [Nonomuraea purpurea]|uniref:Uncharacterized protein n=1 Tax=Nonomuraea purpurea TaxID=1849276 RepID=A0ABV8GA25_9ACTN